MFNKILVAVDGSGRSREMTNMLLQLPSMQRAEITVLHVIPVPASAEGLTEYRVAGERILEKERANLRLSSTNPCTTLLREGDPKDVVCRVADDIAPDLLVMGSRGMGRIQAILGNSVSQYVFQLSAAPMLLVKDDVYIRSIRNAMVAVDTSESSEKCLDLAIALLGNLKDAEILLVRVLAKKVETPESDPAMDKAMAKLKRMGIPFRTFLRSGDPGKEICNAAEEGNASLLMMGSPDRRPSIAKNLPDLDRLLGSSISDYVRVNAGCPVLLTRSPE